MNLDDAIAVCRDAGLAVIEPRASKDDQLRGLWLDAIKVLRMARDIAEDGGRLHFEHPAWLAQSADYKALQRAAIIGMVDAILSAAVVTREGAHAAE